MRADPGGAGTRAGRRRRSRKDRRQCSRPHPANATKKEGAGAGEGVRKAEEGGARGPGVDRSLDTMAVRAAALFLSSRGPWPKWRVSLQLFPAPLLSFAPL